MTQRDDAIEAMLAAYHSYFSASSNPIQAQRDRMNAALGALLAIGLRVTNPQDEEAAHLASTKAAFQQARGKISARLNDYLVEMEPGYDDSVVGFNEAWDIVRKTFDDLIAAVPDTKTAEWSNSLRRWPPSDGLVFWVSSPAHSGSRRAAVDPRRCLWDHW